MGQDKMKQMSPSFEKGWRGGGEDLAKSDLFTRHPECKTRSVLVTIERADGVAAGDAVVLQVQDDALIIRKTETRIGVAASPPSDVASAIVASGGYANGVVGDLHSLSGTADIILK